MSPGREADPQTQGHSGTFISTTPQRPLGAYSYCLRAIRQSLWGANWAAGANGVNGSPSSGSAGTRVAVWPRYAQRRAWGEYKVSLAWLSNSHSFHDQHRQVRARGGSWHRHHGPSS